jgi:tetratricopeptide (TPR) repeat protein
MNQKKQDTATRIFAGVVIGGSILGTAAILLSAPYQAEYRSEPIQAAPVTQALQAAPVEMEPEVVVDAEPEEIELSLPHMDPTNFTQQASDELAAGDFKAALVSLRKSIHGREPAAGELLEIGRVAREIGEKAIAEQALLDAERKAPKNVTIKVELARLYLDTLRAEEAHSLAAEAVALDREDAAAWNLVGRSAMELSNWERADAALSQAVEIDPLNAMYRNNLGLLYIRMKRADQAVDELETAVELFEDRAPHFVFNNLGLAHELAGNLEEAREAFAEALAISPFYARAKVNLRRIETTITMEEEKKAFETAKASDEIESDDLEIGEEL